MTRLRRTHTCGQLREEHVGKTVMLNGWVNTTRGYNDQVFIDLRDRYGLTQVVFEADHAQVFAAAQEARGEWVLAVRGVVRSRPAGMHNPKLTTGDVEVLVEEIHVLNRCPTPPFEVRSVLEATGLPPASAAAGVHRFVSSGDVAWFRALGSRLLGPELDGVEGWEWG